MVALLHMQRCYTTAALHHQTASAGDNALADALFRVVAVIAIQGNGFLLVKVARQYVQHIAAVADRYNAAGALGVAGLGGLEIQRLAKMQRPGILAAVSAGGRRLNLLIHVWLQAQHRTPAVHGCRCVVALAGVDSLYGRVFGGVNAGGDKAHQGLSSFDRVSGSQVKGRQCAAHGSGHVHVVYSGHNTVRQRTARQVFRSQRGNRRHHAKRHQQTKQLFHCKHPFFIQRS